MRSGLHANPPHAATYSRRADSRRVRGTPPAAGTPASGDSGYRSDSGLPRTPLGVPRPPARTAVRETRTADSQPLTAFRPRRTRRSEEHTSELQSLMRISYADFCLKKKKQQKQKKK